MLSLACTVTTPFPPTGELDFTDSVFYWLDKASFLYFPPLLLIFSSSFPHVKNSSRTADFILYLYIPAALMFLAKVRSTSPIFQGIDDADMLAHRGKHGEARPRHFALFHPYHSILHFSQLHPTPSLLIKSS